VYVCETGNRKKAEYCSTQLSGAKSVTIYRSNSSKTSMTSKQLQRPQTLADVAEIARQNSSEFAMALDEFVDEFYLDHPDKMAQQRRLDVIPPSVANPLMLGSAPPVSISPSAGD
jgi:hypothetical protein